MIMAQHQRRMNMDAASALIQGVRDSMSSSTEEYSSSIDDGKHSRMTRR